MPGRVASAVVAIIGLTLALLPASAGAEGAGGVTKTDNVTPVAHFPYIGGAEVDFDGERYLFAAQASLRENLRRESDVTVDGVEGGLRIIDLKTKRQVGSLDCPGTDNYVRYLDPDVYNTPQGNREYVVIAFHGNACTREMLEGDPNTWAGYGAFNGIMIVDVKAKANPRIVSTIGHRSAHTVMPHPTRPYLFVLPGGLANGTTVSVPQERVTVSPTAIIDVSDPRDPVYVTELTHNVQGCHDLGFTHDGEFAYCAGLGEVQVWDISGDRVTDPLVVGAIHNPAIQFAHNVVVSPSGQHLAINDEAFGFHTCSENEAADLYGSLWIYDITVPNAPVLAGRVAPPGHPDPDHRFGTLEDTPVQYGWAQSWCAAHNYNWVPGTDIIVASWFAGGVTAHDISNPLAPELIAHYMPDDGVMWSGHYYGGYLVTGDMRRGTEILDVPELRDAEAAAVESSSTGSAAIGAPRIDMTNVLIPSALPLRPAAQRDPQGGGFCVLP